MSSLLEHYKILGVNAGAGFADVTSSYRRLCRIHHPDVSNDPESEELMKRINSAYTVLREKYKKEAAFRERQSYPRTTRRSSGPDTRAHGAENRKVGAEAEKEALSVLTGYFKAISECEYSTAYGYLSSYDRQHISRDSFVQWRKSVARLYPMREFRISGGQSGVTLSFSDGRTVLACRFRVEVTEEVLAESTMQTGVVEKMVVSEDSVWKVFLGYQGVSELTRSFEEQFEARRKRDINRRWEEYYSGMYPEYNMLSIAGMRKAVLKELYRQKRFGGTLTFAAISLKPGSYRSAGEDELLRSAARTIVGALRETDIPAYAGDGVFAVLLVELRKKNADDIIRRLIEKIRKNAGPQLGVKAEIDYEFASWSGNTYADIEVLNRVLRKFRKKM